MVKYILSDIPIYILNLNLSIILIIPPPPIRIILIKDPWKRKFERKFFFEKFSGIFLNIWYRYVWVIGTPQLPSYI